MSFVAQIKRKVPFSLAVIIMVGFSFLTSTYIKKIANDSSFVLPRLSLESLEENI